MKRKNRKGRGMKILALLHHQIVVLIDLRFFDIEALKVSKRLRDFLLNGSHLMPIMKFKSQINTTHFFKYSCPNPLYEALSSRHQI
ncbi:hypothetical protein [Staphylococcus pseudintermedius]|uniref:hypothetical protein n=1 Tax=Staphylococcus pseudintermedius TaxID=283734 RepID=UPI00137718B7|nr:hypothetical protein [Staphylococcus pseudintermedius]